MNPEELKQAYSKMKKTLSRFEYPPKTVEFVSGGLVIRIQQIICRIKGHKWEVDPVHRVKYCARCGIRNYAWKLERVISFKGGTDEH